MRYRVFDITVTPLGKDNVLVHSGRSSTTKVLSSAQVQMLLACNTFEPLSGHAKAHGQEMQRSVAQNAGLLRGKFIRWALEVAAENDVDIPVRSKETARIERQLSSSVEDGFLVSEADLQAEIREIGNQSVDPGEGSNAISTIGMATCNRTKHLERALDSYVENSRRHGRNTSFVIVDDSEQKGVREETKQVLCRSWKHRDAEIRYVGRERRARFASEIARRAALPAEITRFALLGDRRYGMTYGSAVNALLLHTAGELLLITDDDTVCSPASPPESNLGLALTSRTDPNQFWFFENREAALDAITLADQDILGLHEQLLGRTLRGCISGEGGTGICIDDMSTRFLSNMQRPGAKVGVSFLGTVGDPGSETTTHRLFAEGPTFKRLTKSASQYPSRLSTHEVLKASVQPSISDGAYCMSTNMGLDGRTLLPPFVPVARNCDGVFGHILQACFRKYYRAHLPYVVPHGSPERRSSTSETAYRSLEMLRTNDLLIALINAFDPWHCGSSSEAENLQALGRYLAKLGALPPTDFKDATRRTVTQATSLSIQGAERRLDEKPMAPEYWKADMEKYIATLQEAVTREKFFVPSDLDGSLEERRILFQELVGTFGKLLTHWPDMVETALTLRWEGYPLAQKLSRSATEA
jgi:hypothetical protein